MSELGPLGGPDRNSQEQPANPESPAIPETDFSDYEDRLRRWREAHHLVSRSLLEGVQESEEIYQQLERNLAAAEADIDVVLNLTSDVRSRFQAIFDYYGGVLPDVEKHDLFYSGGPIIELIGFIHELKKNLRLIGEGLLDPGLDFGMAGLMIDFYTWEKLVRSLPFDWEREGDELHAEAGRIEKNGMGKSLIGPVCSVMAHGGVAPLGHTVNAAEATLDFLKDWFSTREITAEDLAYLKTLEPRIEAMKERAEELERRHLELVQWMRHTLGRKDRVIGEQGA